MGPPPLRSRSQGDLVPSIFYFRPVLAPWPQLLRWEGVFLLLRVPASSRHHRAVPLAAGGSLSSRWTPLLLDGLGMQLILLPLHLVALVPSARSAAAPGDIAEGALVAPVR